LSNGWNRDGNARRSGDLPLSLSLSLSLSVRVSLSGARARAPALQSRTALCTWARERAPTRGRATFADSFTLAERSKVHYVGSGERSPDPEDAFMSLIARALYARKAVCKHGSPVQKALRCKKYIYIYIYM
jgi:hypothetical protein